MVNALVSVASTPGSCPGLRHCVMLFGKTLYPHSASLHLGVQMAWVRTNSNGLASHPGGGE